MEGIQGGSEGRKRGRGGEIGKDSIQEKKKGG